MKQNNTTEIYIYIYISYYYDECDASPLQEGLDRRIKVLKHEVEISAKDEILLIFNSEDSAALQ